MAEVRAVVPAPDGPQFRDLWAAAMEEAEFNVNSLSDEELDDVRRAMPDDVEPTAENFERGHRLANLSLDENEDAYERDGVRPVWDDDPEAIISDSIRDIISASQIEETGHTQQFVASDMTDMEGRTFRPNYDEPDPFDFSDPEQARQAKAIEDMNKALGE